MFLSLVSKIGIAASCLLSLGLGSAVAGPVLDKIKDQGVVRICNNVNNPPFSFLSPSGENQGIQVALFESVREKIAETVGSDVKLEIVPALPSNRIQFLQQGKCDLILALTDTPERRKIIRFVEPGYYFDTPALVTKSDLTVGSWDELRGKAVCSNSGSSYNPPLERRFGAQVLTFQTQQEVDQSLRDGRCVGLISDYAFQQKRLQEGGVWADYKIQDLPNYAEPLPSSIAVNNGDEELFALLTALVRDWHRSGKTIELLKEFKLTPPDIMVETQKSLQ